MGHVVNPISLRIYNTKYWNNSWFVFNHFNYSYILHTEILLTKFLRKFFLSYINSTSSGIILVNTKLLRTYDSTNLYLYVHDGFFDLLFLELRERRSYFLLRRILKRRFIRKYKYLKIKSKGRVLKNLTKKILLKYARLFFSIVIKNKILSVFWSNIKTFLFIFMKKINLNFKNITILNLSKSNVNASIISEFFFIRLQQYYTIWEVLRNVNFLFKNLMLRNIVKGYKITCSGRFSRKQRTTYSWKVFGSLGSSSLKSKLDYDYRTIALRYSSCTIKVFVSLSGIMKGRLINFKV